MSDPRNEAIINLSTEFVDKMTAFQANADGLGEFLNGSEIIQLSDKFLKLLSEASKRM